MKLRLITSSKWSSYQIREILEAYDFAIKFYNLANNKGNVTLKLINEDSVLGTADRIKNHRYEIRVKWTDNLKELLETFFHEFTHVSQFINNNFKIKGGFKWEGDSYNLESTKDYLIAPWEVQARGMEYAMYYLFEESR